MNNEQMNKEHGMSKLKAAFRSLFRIPLFNTNFAFLLHHSTFRVPLFDIPLFIIPLSVLKKIQFN